MIKTIPEKEEIEKEKSRVREQMEKDDDEIDNIMDLCYKLQKIPRDKKT